MALSRFSFFDARLQLGFDGVLDLRMMEDFELHHRSGESPGWGGRLIEDPAAAVHPSQCPMCSCADEQESEADENHSQHVVTVPNDVINPGYDRGALPLLSMFSASDQGGQRDSAPARVRT